MNIDGIAYNIVDVYDLSVTLPDSFVVNENKTCGGHGEAKLYMGSKDHMRNFYTGSVHSVGFEAECFILKSDLLQYMTNLCHEYTHPSIVYRGQGTKKNIKDLWDKRNSEINALPEVIKFRIKEQNQIGGNRGYVKSKGNPKKGGYGIIRTVSLPFVSYLSVMKLQEAATGNILFYWKLFADFSQMAEQQYWAKHYGKKKMTGTGRVRDGQIQYRQSLFAQFGHCPFSKIDDVKLLIASHIKPWAICNETEKTDANNGLMLSPLYDKLFDKGYITFENDGSIRISDWLSPANKSRIDFNYNIGDLHLTPQRLVYMDYHRRFVFK